MGCSRMLSAVALAVLMGVYGGGVAGADELLAWGDDSAGQVSDVPTGSDYVAVATGDEHALALKSDGMLVAWGQNVDGQCDVPSGTYEAIGAGACFSLAVRSGGSLVAWGDDDSGQISDVPAGSDYTAVAGGLQFALALKSDGTIVAWGDDRYGQISDVPLTGDFVAIAAGDAHGVALRADGSLFAWGYWGAVEDVPTKGTYCAISAGGNQCLSLTEDGEVVWWGDAPTQYDLDEVPKGDGYSDVTAGYLHALAIVNDGSVVGWGAGTETGENPNWGQADTPTGYTYTAVSAGLYFSVALVESPVVDGAAVADGFSDDIRGAIWSLDVDDASSCWLEETNERLELRSTTKASWASAFYFGNDWTIDPSQDFSLCVDFQQSAALGAHTWLSLVLTPDPQNRGSQHVEFGVGSDDSYPYLWLEAIDETIRFSKSKYRRQAEGTLYISYNASDDDLYVSLEGYGAENAWATVSDLVQKAWKGQAVVLGLGGGSNEATIASGQAWLDNFVLETAGTVVGQWQPVYRFWSPLQESHVYTMSEAEKGKLINEYAALWTFEGTAFFAASVAFDADLAPVYRFWAEKTGAHFYTIDERERDQLLKDGQATWTFEGIAFYAYPEGQQPEDTQPVYRFASNGNGATFHTINEAEKNLLVKQHRDTFTFEGVGFYAFE